MDSIKIQDVRELCQRGSGEYLHNEDGNKNRFCGQCGQSITWDRVETEILILGGRYADRLN